MMRQYGKNAIVSVFNTDMGKIPIQTYLKSIGRKKINLLFQYGSDMLKIRLRYNAY